MNEWLIDWLTTVSCWRQIVDQAVAGSIPGQDAIRSPRLTQPSIPSG